MPRAGWLKLVGAPYPAVHQDSLIPQGVEYDVGDGVAWRPPQRSDLGFGTPEVLCRSSHGTVLPYQHIYRLPQHRGHDAVRDDQRLLGLRGDCQSVGSLSFVLIGSL